MSIRLSGRMTRELVGYMLTYSSHRLEKLEMNNLLQWSELEPPLPHFDHDRSLQEYWRKHRSDHKVMSRTAHMAGALDALTGRFEALTSLKIRSVRTRHRQPHSSWDDRRYSSWARVIDSVCGTLK